MRFFAIERSLYAHHEYPIFFSELYNEVVVGRSDRHWSIVTNDIQIAIKNKNGKVVHGFTNGVSTNGETIREITGESTKHHLLYYISFGSNEMVGKSILSYVNIGGFVGDIVVLSDHEKPKELEWIPRLSFIKVDLAKRFNKTPINRYNIFCCKSLITEYVDVSKYDFLIYSDSDVLATEACLMKLLQTMEEPVLWYSKDTGKLSWRTEAQGKGIVTDEEVNKYGEISVNAGWFMIPTNALGLEILSKWQEMVKSYNYEADDQGCLYALLIREKWNKKLALGIRSAYDGVSMQPPHSESQIIHCYSSERRCFNEICKELVL